MDSKAWTCLHCSQRYAYTDQLKSKVSVPSLFIIQESQLLLNLTPPFVLSYTTSLLTVTFTGLLASHFQRMASQCRFVQPFCVWMWPKSIIACALCVYVCLVVAPWLVYMYALKEQSTAGSTVCNYTWNKVLKFNILSYFGLTGVGLSRYSSRYQYQ